MSRRRAALPATPRTISSRDGTWPTAGDATSKVLVEKGSDEDIKALMEALGLEARLMDLCALQDGAAMKGNLIAGVDANKSGSMVVDFLRGN